MDYTVWQESHMLIECLLNFFRSVGNSHFTVVLWLGGVLVRASDSQSRGRNCQVSTLGK